MMKSLPTDFISAMQQLLGADEAQRLFDELTCEPVVSIRLNPQSAAQGHSFPLTERVPWCETGYYLAERPLFTLDPLFHAGAYYVQEAASMFLEQVMKQHLGDEPVAMLDLCAAPGGKSTHARALLPEGSLLVSNEVMKARAQVLAENLTKWGHPDVVVTRSDPSDYGQLTEAFDVILTDVPCSGEGMFRKDEGAVADWSLENVELCSQRQRRIVADVWPALKGGGLLIYSTYTYNRKEDEENVAWICSELGGEVLPVEVKPEWGITGHYHFYPHRTKGEGLFMAVIRKEGDSLASSAYRPSKGSNGKQRTKEAAVDKKVEAQLRGWLNDTEGAYTLLPQGDKVLAFKRAWLPLLQRLKSQLYLLQAGVAVAEVKGKDLIPHHALAMSTLLKRGTFPEAQLMPDQSLTYLRRDVITLPAETPKGYLLLTYQGHPLGFVKHLGNRTNNLYPPEWRIRHL